MAKPPVPDRAAEPNDSVEEDFYEVPAELDGPDELPADEASSPEDEDGREALASRSPLSRKLTAFVIVGVVALAALGVFAYRAHQKTLMLRAGLERAEQLLRDDTAASYREAARLLEPLAEVDPLEAGSARAFALAMLAADYRDDRAEQQANVLLVVPERAEVLLRRTALAKAALALADRKLGDATQYVTQARDDVSEGGTDARWAELLAARTALHGLEASSARGPAALAAQADAGQPPFPPGLALHGDTLRRSGDLAGAAASYREALEASEAWRGDKRPAPRQPRAIFGLAKVALSGGGSAEEAARHLVDLSRDAETPQPERSRAAIYLAALQLRAGSRENAVAAIEAAGLQGDARTWAERAAAAMAANRGPYRAVTGAPLSLESAVDDDQPAIKPLVPEPPRPPPVVEEQPVKKATAKAPARKSTSKATAGKTTSKTSTKSAKAASTRTTTKKVRKTTR
ncbi:MAG: hypothetical protein QM767_14110 [Anaeromyxobacter sp.]